MLKNTKKTKIVVSSVLLSLLLSGCSLSLNNKDNSSFEIKDAISYDLENGNKDIDEIMSIKSDKKINIKDFDYLIENSKTTNATFAHVVGDSTITSKGKLFDDKKDMSSKTFYESIIQPIILPKSFIPFGYYDLSDIIDSYAECEINCKKMVTLDNETFYSFDSTLTFNSNSKHIGLDIEEGDTINAKSIYKANNDNSLTLLYRNQTGIKEDSSNVLENNYNNDKEILVPIEDTIFNDMNGEYNKEYLYEALDVYSGKDNYYSKENDGIDFSNYKKN